MATEAIKKIYRGVVSYLQYWRGEPVDTYKIYGVDDKSIPFYVENITTENETLNISSYGSYVTPTMVVEKSVDGVNWESFGKTGPNYGTLTYTLTPGSRLYLRAVPLKESQNGWGVYSAEKEGYNHITGVSKVGGNIMSLIFGSSFTGNETTVPTPYAGSGVHVLGYIFRNNTRLQNASHLNLPATALTNYCYSYLFAGCTNLTAGPMLPATGLAGACYSHMFDGCTSLQTVTCLAINISATNCLNNWMNNVPASGTFVKKASTTFPTGTSGIPSGWTIRNV